MAEPVDETSEAFARHVRFSTGMHLATAFWLLSSVAGEAHEQTFADQKDALNFLSWYEADCQSMTASVAEHSGIDTEALADKFRALTTSMGKQKEEAVSQSLARAGLAFSLCVHEMMAVAKALNVDFAELGQNVRSTYRQDASDG